MKYVKPLQVTAYEFDDLDEEGKHKVLADQVKFVMELAEMDDEFREEIKDEIEEAERLQTPWFLGQIILDNKRDYLLDMIKANKYLFDSKGKQLPITYHTKHVGNGKHETVKITWELTQDNHMEVELV